MSGPRLVPLYGPDFPERPVRRRREPLYDAYLFQPKPEDLPCIDDPPPGTRCPVCGEEVQLWKPIFCSNCNELNRELYRAGSS